MIIEVNTMEENILAILKETDKALDIHEINDMLGFTTVDELKELIKCLNDLEEKLKVYRTKKDRYLLFNNSNLKIGKMIANKKGYGFVDIEGPEDVFVAPTNMNNAIHGDDVVVEIITKKGLQMEGRIVKIVSRKLKQMVGELYYDKFGNPCIDLDDEKVKINVKLDKQMMARDDAASPMGNARKVISRRAAATRSKSLN